MLTKSMKVLIISIFSVVSVGSTASADDAAMMTMLQNLQKQMGSLQEMVRSQQKTIDVQGRVINELQKKKAVVMAPGAENPSTTELPDWLEGLKWSGDLRLRYEGNSDTSPTGDDRNRFRYRFRYGAEKKFNDQLKAGFRLASGNIGNITTRNTSFDTQFGLKGIGIDRVYGTYTPTWAKVGPIKSLELTGGKFKNPFEDGSTWMVWDRDIQPEGIYEKIVLDVMENEHIDLDASLLAGQFIVEEGAASDHDDSELYAWQGGFHSKINAEGFSKPITMKNILSHYNYSDFTRAGNFGAAGGNFINGSGNLTAGDFDIIEVYNEFGFQPENLPAIKIFYDWAINADEVADDALGGGQEYAWNLGLKIGSAKKKGQWELGYQFARIEANALPGVFSDGDFGRANRQGSVIKFGYGLTDYLKLSSTVYITEAIHGDGIINTDDHDRTFQLNLVWKL